MSTTSLRQPLAELGPRTLTVVDREDQLLIARILRALESGVVLNLEELRGRSRAFSSWTSDAINLPEPAAFSGEGGAEAVEAARMSAAEMETEGEDDETRWHLPGSDEMNRILNGEDDWDGPCRRH